MPLCKTVELFYALIPWKPWRGFLIRSHIEKCPSCLTGLASREEAGCMIIRESGVGIDRPFWAAIELALREEAVGKETGSRAAQPPVMRRWVWAVGATLLLVLIASFFLLKDFRPEEAASAATVPARFELDYVRVGGETANTFIYRPQGSDMVIVWAGKSP